MTCEEVRNELSLLLYGELKFDDEEAIEQHLEGCPACRASLEREKALHAAFDLSDTAPPAGMLASCRRELFTGVRNGERRGWLARLVPDMGTWLKPAGALALLLIGFAAARLTTAPSTMTTSSVPSPNDVVATKVRYVEPGQDGGVEIVLEETRQRRIAGSLADEGVRRLLLAAAEDPTDPGLRVESVGLLTKDSDAMDVRGALLRAVRADPNPGVRLKALEGLKEYSRDREVRRALSHVLLNDDNAGIRTQAVDLLVQHRESEMIGVLQQLMRHEDNDYIRQRSQRVLREMNASVDTF